jgi:GTP cyclohydrolase IA
MSGFKKKKIKRAVRMLLESIPLENADREGLLDTPSRVARMYEEIYCGYLIDPQSYLERHFESDGYQQMIIVRDIPIFSTCEHHLATFSGVCHIGYIPSGRVVGISKLARVAEAYSRRLQIQERLTKQIADCITEVLKPKGVIVVIKAEHTCMTMRGIKKAGALTVTSEIQGVFLEPTAKAEFYENLKI